MEKQMISKESVFAPPVNSRRYKIVTLNLCRNILLKLLSRLRYGTIEIHDGENTYSIGEKCEKALNAIIRVNDPFFYPAVILGGSIGAGESYMRCEWTCDNLTTLIRIILQNRDVLESMDNGFARLSTPIYKLFHISRKNTKRGSKKNISDHYNLGNDFYELFLDDTLAYSCGIFSSKKATLKEASIEKFDRICKKLRLAPDDHLLEIGTGWGGFAIYAAQKYGCRITTTTISQKQYDFAKKKIGAAGLTPRIHLLLNDYRELKGRFDKLVSIEMIEAVGHQYYKIFFQCCHKLLKPNGLMLLQAITIRDQVYEQHKKSVDFIKRYIFPGSCIPSVTAMISTVSSATDMKIFNLEDITPHYAKTLQLWRRNFFSEIDAVRRQGFPESFIRMWEFYLCYCEAGFTERYLGDVQMVFVKPNFRQDCITLRNN